LLFAMSPLGRMPFLFGVTALNMLIFLVITLAFSFRPSGAGHMAVLVVVGALQALWFVLHGRRFADAGRPKTGPLLMTLLCFGSFAVGYMITAALWSSPEIQQEAFRTTGGIAGAGPVLHLESNPFIAEGGRMIAGVLGAAGAVVLSGFIVAALAGVTALSGAFSLFALLLPSGMRGFATEVRLVR
jgi:hypothetical protein